MRQLNDVETTWMYADCIEPPFHLFQFEDKEAMCMDEEDFVTSFYQQRLSAIPSQEEELELIETLLAPMSLHREFQEEFRGV